MQDTLDPTVASEPHELLGHSSVSANDKFQQDLELPGKSNKHADALSLHACKASDRFRTSGLGQKPHCRGTTSQTWIQAEL